MSKVIIVGASGMIGKLILEHCLFSSEISQVCSLVRRKIDINNAKLNEVVISDFSDYSEQVNLFKNIDVAYFCIGVYTGQVSDDVFKKITVDYAVAFADTLKANSSNATLCF